jgi:hypothetical protein
MMRCNAMRCDCVLCHMAWLLFLFMLVVVVVRMRVGWVQQRVCVYFEHNHAQHTTLGALVQGLGMSDRDSIRFAVEQLVPLEI